MIRWRPLVAADLPAVVSVAAVVHPGFPERPEVLDEKRALYPAGAWAAVDAGGRLVGYALAHAGRLGHVPALNALMGTLPAPADCLYLHDVALLPEARGRGLARAVLALWEAQAARQGLGHLALTAVNGSAPTWAALGFQTQGAGAALARKLASYGPDALYMVKALAAAPAAA